MAAEAATMLAVDVMHAAAEPARARVDAALARLGCRAPDLPSSVLAGLHHRARQPASRLVVGRYLVVRELGRRGMRVVFEGWDPDIGRPVAIKAVEPGDGPEDEREHIVARFRRQTQVVSRLQHRALLTIFDCGKEPEGLASPSLVFRVTAFVEGPPLSQVLRDRGPVPAPEALAIGAAIAEALHVCHEAGVVHGAIDPSNVVLRDEGDPVLIDVGGANRGPDAPHDPTAARADEPHPGIDRRADIHSLGGLMFTMLTGKAPVVVGGARDMTGEIAQETSSSRDVGGDDLGLSALLNRLLAERPEDRFTTAAEAAAELWALKGERTEARERAGDAPRLSVLGVGESEAVVAPVASAALDDAPTEAQLDAPNRFVRSEAQAARRRRSGRRRNGEGTHRSVDDASSRAGFAEPSVRVHVSGPGMGEDTHRFALGPRRRVLLIAGALASAAVGLMMARLHPAAPVSPSVHARPRVSPAPAGAEEPALVRPRTPRELILDASAARASGRPQHAARLYSRALEVLSGGHALAAAARLGYAESLREQGREADALAEFQAVVQRYPATKEAADARAALDALAEPSASPPPRPAPPMRAPAGSIAHRPPPSMEPAAACRWVLSRYIKDPTAAVAALENLRDAHPSEPCVYWNLGRKYEALQQHRSAVAAYRRFLVLMPDSPRAPAVERRITELNKRLRRPVTAP